MQSDEGVAMLGARRHQRLDRIGTIVGLMGDNYVVHRDGNAKATVKPYARRYIKIIQSAPKAPQAVFHRSISFPFEGALFAAQQFLTAKRVTMPTSNSAGIVTPRHREGSRWGTSIHR